MDTVLFDEYCEDMRKYGLDPDKMLESFMRSALIYHNVPYVAIDENVPEPNCYNDGRIDWSQDPWRRIHPYKRNNVCTLLYAYDIPETIDEIIIFGSAVTQRCRISSDLDVMILSSHGFKRGDVKDWQPGPLVLRDGRPSLGIVDWIVHNPKANSSRVIDEAYKNGVSIYKKNI